MTGSGCWPGSRRGLERHQTLRNTVQWSYDLLDDDDRLVLDRCSVFAGGFDLAAACHLSDDRLDEYQVMDRLDSLVRKSLVVAEPVAGHVRYTMLETIRQFAEEQLAASGSIDVVRGVTPATSPSRPSPTGTSGSAPASGWPWTGWRPSTPICGRVPLGRRPR